MDKLPETHPEKALPAEIVEFCILMSEEHRNQAIFHQKKAEQLKKWAEEFHARSQVDTLTAEA